MDGMDGMDGMDRSDGSDGIRVGALWSGVAIGGFGRCGFGVGAEPLAADRGPNSGMLVEWLPHCFDYPFEDHRETGAAGSGG